MFRYHITYGLFPVQDTGLIIGVIQADQSISFQAMKTKFTQLQDIVQEDPAVESVVGFTGGRSANNGFLYSSLKPSAERKVTADEVVNRLRPKLAEVAGARLIMFAVSDLRTGGPTVQRRLSIYAPLRRHRGPLCMDSQADPGADGQRHRQGRQFRPADGRPADQRHDRSRHRDAARPDLERYRQYALRRLRPAPGVDHLQPVQPVPCRDGSRAALLAGSAHPRADLRFDVRRGSQRRPADGNRRGRLRILNREGEHGGDRRCRIRRAIWRPTPWRRAVIRSLRRAQR